MSERDDNIKAEKIAVKEIFGEKYRFEIPNFQRPFSWKRENFEKLFENIYDALESNQSEYFMGSIILQKQKDYYYIIDGQQRLISLAILLAVIRDKISDEETRRDIQSSLFQKEIKIKHIPAVVRVKMWEDMELLEDYIYKEGETLNYKNIKYMDKKDPKYSLYEAIHTFIDKYEEEFDDEGKVKRFLEYLFNNVYVVFISTRSLPYAIQLFNVLNTTGLPLSTADILKASNIGEIEENMRNIYARKWREVENAIGREEVEKVIEFIRTMKLKTKARKGIYEEYKKSIFGKYLHKGKEFVDYFVKISKIYRDIVLEPDDLRIHPKYKHIIRLMKRHIPFDDWIPPLIAFYEKFKGYRQNGNDISEYLYKFLINLERKTVIEWVLGYTFTKRVNSFNGVISVIDEEDKPEGVIQKVIPGEIKETKDLDKIKDAFKERINFEDFYNENFAKYLLLRIDLEMWDPDNYSPYEGEITVEHILPQNPPPDNEWCKLFNENDREELTNKIGNLVLLSRRKNSRANNYDFEKKKTAYFLKGGKTPFQITNSLENVRVWDRNALSQRQEEMINKLLTVYFGER